MATQLTLGSGNDAAANVRENGQLLENETKVIATNPRPAQHDGRAQHDDDSLDSDATTTRDKWNNQIDFLLACVGFSVGLGNVWRFPYLCYTNGGGAFLIPYFTCVVLGGIPMFYLEVALGQFQQQGGIGAWKICPLLQGIGVATTVIVFLLNIYYNVILAWAFYYLFASFTNVLPWSHCNNDWNTDKCVVNVNQPVANSTHNQTVLNAQPTNSTSLTAVVTSVYESVTTNVSEVARLHTDPVSEFWERKVLRISKGIEEPGSIQWELALCLLLAWIVVYFCIWKGVKSSGKVMYFTATSPYVIMMILLIRGVTLPGAIDGIKFYVIPEWERLLDPKVWVDAGTQIFFSYSISLGALTALGSYNKYHHNSYRDTVLFACTNSVTSFIAGFVIFAVLGFMASEQGIDVGSVAESGPGLAFIAYPKAIAQMPVPTLWSILFFLMIILLGLDSQFVGVEGFITAVTDHFGPEMRRGYRKEIFIGVICFISFLAGLPMVTNGGMYVFQLMDYYSGSRIILLVAFFECAAIGWIYGASRFYKDVENMLGFRMGKYMYISWTVTAPLFSVIMFGMCVYSYSELTYNRTYRYPRWAIIFGWMMACTSVFMIPIIAVYKLATAEGSFKERLHSTITPIITPPPPEEDSMEFDEISAAKQIAHNNTIVLNTEIRPEKAIYKPVSSKPQEQKINQQA